MAGAGTRANSVIIVRKRTRSSAVCTVQINTNNNHNTPCRSLYSTWVNACLFIVLTINPSTPCMIFFLYAVGGGLDTANRPSR